MLVYTVLKMQTNKHQTEKVENTTFKATIPKKKKRERLASNAFMNTHNTNFVQHLSSAHVDSSDDVSLATV